MLVSGAGVLTLSGEKVVPKRVATGVEVYVDLS
jgi:hypothetical protein